MHRKEAGLSVHAFCDGRQATPERERLARWGFSAEETAFLPQIQQYQDGGSERASNMRPQEFLTLLARSDELEWQLVKRALSSTVCAYRTRTLRKARSRPGIATR